MNTSDFLNAALEGNVTDLDMYNYVEEVTSKFERVKLKLLLEDVELKIWMERDNFLSDNKDLLEEEIDKLLKQGKELPYSKLPIPKDSFKGTDFYESVLRYNSSRIIDKKKILDHHISMHLIGLTAIKSLIIVQLEERKSSNLEKIIPIAFTEIFTIENWVIYIDALYKVANPILDKEYNFIGKPKLHKGVVCSWVKDLQTKGIINKKFNRQELVTVLNNEIKGLNLGKDGKTFDNTSTVYEESYKENLLKLIR